MTFEILTNILWFVAGLTCGIVFLLGTAHKYLRESSKALDEAIENNRKATEMYLSIYELRDEMYPQVEIDPSMAYPKYKHEGDK